MYNAFEQVPKVIGLSHSSLVLKRLIFIFALSIVSACGLADAVLVEGVAPNIVIEKHPAAYSNESTAQFVISCSKPDCVFECAIASVSSKTDDDEPSFIVCPPDYRYENLIDGMYRFSIRASDDGNRTSKVVSVEWKVDTVDPSIELLSAPTKVSGAVSAEFDFRCIDQNPCGLSCQIDGGKQSVCEPPIFLKLPNGPHELVIIAADAAGNTNTSTSIRWTVDETTPEISEFSVDFGLLDGTPGAIPDPYDDLTNSSTATFRFRCNEEACTYLCRVDESETIPCDSPFEVFLAPDTSGSNGLTAFTFTRSFMVQAIDASGNESDWLQHLWTIDIRPPSLRIISGPEATTIDKAATFEFFCDETACEFQCNLDGQGAPENWIWQDCIWPLTIPGQQGHIEWLPGEIGLRPGQHVFRVRAIDSAGNLSTEDAEHHWTVIGDWRTMSTSGEHVCAIDGQGYMWCWGNNSARQGGVPDQQLLKKPTRIGNSDEWVKVTAKTRTSCGIKQDGSYWCWGYNGPTALYRLTDISSGANSYIDSPRPAALTNWKKLSIGSYHGCALSKDGLAYAWGSNSGGRLGTNTQYSYVGWKSGIPRTPRSELWKDIDCRDHSCGIQTDGRLACWGYNWYGQLGVGDTDSRPLPETVANPSTGTSTAWRKVSVGNDHTCAIDSSTNLWCWGQSEFGRLGDPAVLTDLSVLLPNLVGTLNDTWKEIAAGPRHSCGIKTDGSLWCWGANDNGQLGLGHQTDMAMPTRVGPKSDWAQIKLGHREGTSCALNEDSTLFCWGRNRYSQMGDRRGDQSIPTKVGDGYASVQTGADHTCAIKSDNTAWCWGSNSDGQLGNANIQSATSTPTEVLGPDGSAAFNDWQKLSVGDDSTMGIRTNGVLYGWGKNYNGQLGHGTIPSTGFWPDLPDVAHPIPVNISQAVAWGEISTGGDHTCGIGNGDNLWCWGVMSSGQVGNGRTSMSFPGHPNLWFTNVPQSIGSNWSSVSAGRRTSCGIQTDKELYCWGYGGDGQLASGSTVTVSSPSLVAPGQAWDTIEVGGRSACAISSDQDLYCWGNNASGQLGTGDRVSTVSITPSGTMHSDWTAVQISIGRHYNSWNGATTNACALRGPTGQSSLWCWGVNDFGETGTGAPDASILINPTSVTRVRNGTQEYNLATGWKQVSLSDTHACAVRDDTSLWCWGTNEFGQLGHSDRESPLWQLQPGHIPKP